MNPSKFPEKRSDDIFEVGPGMQGVHELFQRFVADAEAQMQQLMTQISNQVHFEETNDAFIITVYLDGIEQPKDIEARYENGQLHLRRTVQLQTQRDGENGGVLHSYYQRFERNLLLPAHIDWSNRRVTSRPGSWCIQLPKS